MVQFFGASSPGKVRSEQKEREPLLAQKDEEVVLADDESDCDDWGPPPDLESGKFSDEKESEGCGLFFYSIGGGLLMLPLLVGAWCWPALVAAFLGIAVSQSAIMLSHSLQFALLLALVSNFTQYLFVKAHSEDWTASRKTHMQRFGPIYLTLFSGALMMAQSTLFVFKDTGCKVKCMLSNYPLVWVICNFMGYTLFIIAVFWGLGFCEKFQTAWKNLRRKVNDHF